MKQITLFVIVCILTACSANRKQSPRELIAAETDAGNFTRASQIIDSLLLHREMSNERKEVLRFAKDSLHRLMLDFNRSREEISSWIE